MANTLIVSTIGLLCLFTMLSKIEASMAQVKTTAEAIVNTTVDDLEIKLPVKPHHEEDVELGPSYDKALDHHSGIDHGENSDKIHNKMQNNEANPGLEIHVGKKSSNSHHRTMTIMVPKPKDQLKIEPFHPPEYHAVILQSKTLSSSNNTTSQSNKKSQECIAKEEPEFYQAVFIVQGVVLPLLCWTGIITNIINLIVLTRPTMRNSTNVFLIGISISDSFILFIASTYYIRFVSLPDLPLFDPCQIEQLAIFWQFYFYTWYMFANVFLTISNWLIMGVTVFRYIAVCFPMRAVRWCTATRARIGIGISVVLAVGLNMPDFFIVTVKSVIDDDIQKMINGSVKNRTLSSTSSSASYRMEYTDLYDNETFTKVYYDIKMSLNVFLPWLVCCILIIRLVLTLKRRANEIKRLSEGETLKNSMARTQRRISVMLIVLNFWFLFCQLPSMVYYIFMFINGRQFAEDKSTGVRILRAVFADTFLCLNYSVNFFLYSASNRQYRHTFRRLLTKQRDRSSYYKTANGSVVELLKTASTSIDMKNRSIKFKNGFSRVNNTDI